MSWRFTPSFILLRVNVIISPQFREFAVMFAEADKNKNGRIDFDEFVDMMLPSANETAAPNDGSGPRTRQI